MKKTINLLKIKMKKFSTELKRFPIYKIELVLEIKKKIKNN